MIDGKELLEFAVEMITVLREKAEKYEKNNNYEDCTEEFLFEQIEKQIEKFKMGATFPYKRRRLTHIANFCFLLAYKLLKNYE